MVVESFKGQRSTPSFVFCTKDSHTDIVYDHTSIVCSGTYVIRTIFCGFITQKRVLNRSSLHCSIFTICFSLPVDRAWVFPLMKLFKMISSDVFYPGAIAALINPQGFMIMDNSRASQQSMWKNIPSIATSLLHRASSRNKSTKFIVGEWKELQHLSKHFEAMRFIITL